MRGRGMMLKADDHGNSSSSSSSSSAIVPAGLQAEHQLELDPIYTSVSIRMIDMILPILHVMVRGVEKGPDAVCEGIRMPSFMLIPASERGIEVRWRQVVKMMRVLARWAVAQDRYGEVVFTILRDGDPIATGMVRRW